jgi:hypothetical protein
MTDLNRRTVVQALGAAATIGPFAIGTAQAQAHKGDIVIGAGQPITGVFAFAGVAMNNGLNDFIQWKNANGGVQGRKLRYVVEDSGFARSTSRRRSSRRSWPAKSRRSTTATARRGSRRWPRTRSPRTT